MADDYIIANKESKTEKEAKDKIDRSYGKSQSQINKMEAEDKRMEKLKK